MPNFASRRRFLGALAGTAGAALFAQGRILRAADDNSKYGGYVMGIQSYSLRNFPTDRMLQILHDDLGLHAVEAIDMHFPAKSSDQEIKQIKDKAAANDVKYVALGVASFTKDHEANRKFFEFAKKTGVKNITADPTEDSFDSLDKLVEEFDIRVAIHNHGPGSRYDKVTDVLNAIKGHHKKIGACADLGHYIRSAEDPVKVINLLEGRLYGIHLKDFADQKAQTQGVILGKGHLDVPAVFKALKKVNFPADGCLSLEYEENYKNPIADIQACLAAAAEGAQKAAKS